MRGRAILAAVALIAVACSTAPAGTRKAVHDLSDEEREALHGLIVKIYKEAFGVIGPGEEPPEAGGYRTALFRGVMVYALPSDLKNRLERPIESISMHSGFVWDSSKGVREKIRQQIDRWSVRVGSSGSASGGLRITKYEIDHMPALPGMGGGLTTVTLIPLEVTISEGK